MLTPPEHIINGVKEKLQSTELQNVLTPMSYGHRKETLKKEFDVLLAQRKMKATDVIGPLTREFFGLDD